MRKFEFDSEVSKTLLFGENMIVMKKESSVVELVSVAGYPRRSIVTLGFVPRDMLHPTTYLNKILFWSSTELSLYNVNTANLIFCLNEAGEIDKYLREGIECLQQSPVVDVVCFGTAKGHIVLIDIKKACLVKTFSMSNAPTCFSFSTDISRDPL